MSPTESHEHAAQLALRESASASRFARHDGAPPERSAESRRSWRATAALVFAAAAVALVFVLAVAGLAANVVATALALPARTSTISRDRPGRIKAKIAFYLALAGVVLNASLCWERQLLAGKSRMVVLLALVVALIGVAIFYGLMRLIRGPELAELSQTLCGDLRVPLPPLVVAIVSPSSARTDR